MPQAISYIRFSSEQQSKGSSTDRQRRMIVDWLQKNPSFKLSSLLSAEDEAKSGYKGEHLKHGLGAILGAIESGKICRGDVLLVEAVDRLGRLPPLEMFDLVRAIVSAGVTIITLQDGLQYDEKRLNDDASALFVLAGKVQQAHYYSKSLSERLSEAYVTKRKKARAGEQIVIATPFWLNTDGSIRSDEAKAVKACIDLYLKGRGPRRVLRELEDVYPLLKDIHPSTLKRWFSNRALIGEWANKGDPIRGVFVPLVDESTFFELQKELKHKSKNMSPEETYSLSGLVVCDKCNGRYLYRRKHHSDYVIVYANCGTYLKRGNSHCCNNKTWPYQFLEYVFRETYHTVLGNIIATKASENGTKELALLRAKKDELSGRIKHYTRMSESVEDLQEIYDLLNDLKCERLELEISISKIEEAIQNEAPLLTLGTDMGREQLRDLKESDPIVLRELLKRNGYQIRLNSNFATVAHQEDSSRKKVEQFLYVPDLIEQRILSKYELIRRSTQYNCYIVRRDVKWNMDTFCFSNDDISMIYEYAAVFRDGEILVETTESNLIEALKNRKMLNQ